MSELKYREEWNGEYRGVKFEIAKWKLGDMMNWNYYLFLPIDQIPEEKRKIWNLPPKYKSFFGDKKYLIYDYNESPFCDLDWHGGITYYSKEFEEKRLMGIKMGCDYAHYWDIKREYCLDEVFQNTKNTIDKLWEHIPDLKLRCSWDGKYYETGEVEVLQNGNTVAKKNLEKYNKKI